LHPQEIILLEECRTLWGEHEQVHVQNMEQLHAHDCYQNATEHKSTDMHNTEIGSGQLVQSV